MTGKRFSVKEERIYKAVMTMKIGFHLIYLFPSHDPVRANLSTYMRTFKRKLKTEILLSKVVINGDDICFEGNLEHYQNWRTYAGRIGLQVNEVKTYFHRHYGLINSFFFNRKTFQKIRYAPYALSVGHRVKSEPKFTLFHADRIYNFLLSSPKCYHKALKKNFFHQLKSIVKKLEFDCRGVKFQPNFFLPRYLGGLNLQELKGRFHITRPQRALALYLMRNPTEGWLMEKMDHLPTGAELGIRKFLKIKPPESNLVVGGRAVFFMNGESNRVFQK